MLILREKDIYVLNIHHSLLSRLLKIIVPASLLVGIWHIWDLVKYPEHYRLGD